MVSHDIAATNKSAIKHQKHQASQLYFLPGHYLKNLFFLYFSFVCFLNTCSSVWSENVASWWPWHLDEEDKEVSDSRNGTFRFSLLHKAREGFCHKSKAIDCVCQRGVGCSWITPAVGDVERTEVNLKWQSLWRPPHRRAPDTKLNMCLTFQTGCFSRGREGVC